MHVCMCVKLCVDTRHLPAALGFIQTQFIEGADTSDSMFLGVSINKEISVLTFEIYRNLLSFIILFWEQYSMRNRTGSKIYYSSWIVIKIRRTFLNLSQCCEMSLRFDSHCFECYSTFYQVLKFRKIHVGKIYFEKNTLWENTLWKTTLWENLHLKSNVFVKCVTKGKKWTVQQHFTQQQSIYFSELECRQKVYVYGVCL